MPITKRSAKSPPKSLEDSLSSIILSDLAYRRDAARSRKAARPRGANHTDGEYWNGFEWGIIVAVCDILRALQEDGIITQEMRDRLDAPFAT